MLETRKFKLRSSGSCKFGEVDAVYDKRRLR